MKEGITEWSSVIGAILIGNIHELKEIKAENADRGGWVDGVRMSLVRAVSSGERMMLAIPADETATASEIAGDAEDNISNPPSSGVGEANAVNRDVRPGSGRDRTAARKDLEKEVRVDKRNE